MIFVTVGVQLPFDRLIKAMDAWAGDHPEIEVVAQTGATTLQCHHMRAFPRIEGPQFDALVEQADLIVAHAGMGSILTALELGKPIIVVPRKVALGEHRNDHQAATSRYMAQADLVKVASDTDELPSLIANRHLLQSKTITPTAQTGLIEAVSQFLKPGTPRRPPNPLKDADLPVPAAPLNRNSVSVIIPHYNDLANLARCLDALKSQTLAAAEIIVCDNGSPCGLDAVERVCGSSAKVILELEKGAAAARNAAIHASHSDILAFLDSDCLPDQAWIEEGCKGLDQAELVGGRISLSFKNADRRTPVEAFEAQFAFANQRYIEEEHFSVTANMFVRRATFESVGPFRPGVPEDKDWGQRAHHLGYRWAYAANARVIHPARYAWPDLRRKWQRLSREAYAMSRSRRGVFLARSWLLILSLPVFAARLAQSRQLERWSERAAATLILIRLRGWRFLECHRLVFADLFQR